jgi:hypothetical protein
MLPTFGLENKLIRAGADRGWRTGGGIDRLSRNDTTAKITTSTTCPPDISHHTHSRISPFQPGASTDVYQLAYNPVSFCKCICFNNATIIPISDPTDPSKPCADCPHPSPLTALTTRHPKILLGLSSAHLSWRLLTHNPRRRHGNSRHFHRLFS